MQGDLLISQRGLGRFWRGMVRSGVDTVKSREKAGRFMGNPARYTEKRGRCREI
jgi:hypothetical protein